MLGFDDQVFAIKTQALMLKNLFCWALNREPKLSSERRR